MKTRKYTETSIIAILRQAEGGVPVAELCREYGLLSRQIACIAGQIRNTGFI